MQKAIKWCKKAAKQGEVNAQYELALYYDEQQQQKEALKWFQKAAEQGHNEALYCLTVFYEQNIITERICKKH